VYVECKNGFATTPRRKMFHPLNYIEGDIVDVGNSKSVGTPLELAILVQKWCRPFYTLCHGLLGGMALLHIILVSVNPADGFKFERKFSQEELNTEQRFLRVYDDNILFHTSSGAHPPSFPAVPGILSLG
jgi:hypothetical protein